MRHQQDWRQHRVRSMNWMTRYVHNLLLSIAGRGALPRDAGNFEEIAMSAEAALPHPRRTTDAVYPTLQPYASTKLIAEALHYIKVAAGRIVDLHDEVLGEDEQRRARAFSIQDERSGVSWRSYRDELPLDRYREEQSQAQAQRAAATGAGSRHGGPSSSMGDSASSSPGATSSGCAAAGSARPIPGHLTWGRTSSAACAACSPSAGLALSLDQYCEQRSQAGAQQAELDRRREEQSRRRRRRAEVAAAGAGSRPGGSSPAMSHSAFSGSGATSSGGAAAGSARRSACAASLPPGGPAQQRLKTTASSGSWQRWG